jgi:hypothetical protein
MDRRSFLQRFLFTAFAAPAVAPFLTTTPIAQAAVPIAAPVAAVVTPKLWYLASEYLCLLDARYMYNFKDQVEAVLGKMEKELRETGGKWEITWQVDYDKDTNPMGTMGRFVAFPAPDDQEEDICFSFRGMQEHLTELKSD